MTDSLTGRDLDGAVHEAMGWHWEVPNPLVSGSWFHPELSPMRSVPAYSAPDCSGLAPVLAWLKDQSEPGAVLTIRSLHDQWEVGYGNVDNWLMVWSAPTLPEAACRLLVSWSERKGT